ncbi:MAG: glycosyltransferase family 4 protein [Chloroflexota bacterium]
MTPIRVLHPITRLIVGGAQENTMYTATLLDKARFQAEILCGPQTGSEGSLIEEVRQRGVPLTILPDLLRQVSPLHDLRALGQLVGILRRGNYTIVHTHSSKAGILGRLAARLAGTPVVVHTVHGWSFHDYMPPLVRQTYILLERLCAAFSDALIVVAQGDIEKGLRAGIGSPSQYHLIRSAIPLDEFDPAHADPAAVRRELGLPEGAIVIGNIGRFSPQKNPLDWVRVAGKIGRAHAEVRFLMVGDGPLRPQVEELLAQEGLAGRAVLTGLRRDVPRLLSAMDIFLLTSLWEGLPRVIPQAMAMRLPVVANRADGVSEAIQDEQTGCLCAAGDIDAAARRCQELVENPQKRLSMGQSARDFAKQEFDLDHMLAQIAALYDTLQQSKAPMQQ